MQGTTRKKWENVQRNYRLVSVMLCCDGLTCLYLEKVECLQRGPTDNNGVQSSFVLPFVVLISLNPRQFVLSGLCSLPIEMRTNHYTKQKRQFIQRTPSSYRCSECLDEIEKHKLYETEFISFKRIMQEFPSHRATNLHEMPFFTQVLILSD